MSEKKQIRKLEREVKELHERLERIEQSSVQVKMQGGVLRAVGDGFSPHHATKLRVK